MDDDTFNVFSLQCILKDIFGLQSDFSYSGNEAIKLIKNRAAECGHNYYKVIFMDLNMPGLNGLETTHIIRKLGSEGSIRMDETKIVLYSCLSNTSDLPYLRKQFDEVANKPADIQNMKEILVKFQLIKNDQ